MENRKCRKKLEISIWVAPRTTPIVRKSPQFLYFRLALSSLEASTRKLVEDGRFQKFCRVYQQVPKFLVLSSLSDAVISAICCSVKLNTRV